MQKIQTVSTDHVQMMHQMQDVHVLHALHTRLLVHDMRIMTYVT
jgi:hypothetical protein